MSDGDQRAAAELHEACVTMVYRIAYTIVRDHAEADEITSDTFAKAWRDSASFDSNRGSVEAWLTIITQSRARDVVRTRKRRARMQDRADAMAATDAAGVHLGWSPTWSATRAIESAQQQQVLHQALRQLPDTQRDAVVLVFFQHMSHAVAARALRLPLGTVKTRIRLGLRQLRAVLLASGHTPLTL